MALIEIPVDPNIASQKFQIILDGALFNLRFYWNTRQDTWAIDISNDAEEPLIQGIKIMPNWMSLFRYQIPGFPGGDFIVVDTTGGGVPPERTEFGTDARVKLLYEEAA